MPISGFNTSPKDSSGVIVTTYNEGRGQQGCLAEDQTADWNRYINRSHDGGLNRKLFFFFKKGVERRDGGVTKKTCHCLKNKNLLVFKIYKLWFYSFSVRHWLVHAEQ